jgi:hypothetical protein
MKHHFHPISSEGLRSRNGTHPTVRCIPFCCSPTAYLPACFSYPMLQTDSEYSRQFCLVFKVLVRGSIKLWRCLLIRWKWAACRKAKTTAWNVTL